MDVILDDGISNPIKRELVNTIHASISRNDTETSFNIRENSSQENENRNYDVEISFRLVRWGEEDSF